VHPQDRKCTPGESKSQFYDIFLLGELDLEIYLDRLLRATTKKRSSTFSTKKTAPPDKILSTPMVQLSYYRRRLISLL